MVVRGITQVGGGSRRKLQYLLIARGTSLLKNKYMKKLYRQGVLLELRVKTFRAMRTVHGRQISTRLCGIRECWCAPVFV
jgi:hypothetical protein